MAGGGDRRTVTYGIWSQHDMFIEIAVTALRTTRRVVESRRGQTKGADLPELDHVTHQAG